MSSELEEKIEKSTIPTGQFLEETSLHPARAEDFGSTALTALKDDEMLLEHDSTVPIDAELAQEQKLELAQSWIDTQDIQFQTDPVPEDIAFEVALLLQKRKNVLGEDDFVDAEYYQVVALRDKAVEAASELDFELIRLSNNKDDWPLHVRLNAMHDKFKKVSTEEVSSFLGPDDDEYEYKAMHVRNIIADHAPALLTENLKVLLDPSQPPWRTSSAHASILLRKRSRTRINAMQVDQMPMSLPIGNRGEYKPEDNEVARYLSDMSDEELALYCHQDSLQNVKERGYALFGELTLPARETLLTRRLFEAIGKSSTPDMVRQADERNRGLEYQPTLQQGDLVHATGSTEIFEQVLASGLQCGEAIMGNDRSIINNPFTVSFLEVDQDISKPASMSERLELLHNSSYGAINMVLHQGDASIETVRDDIGRVPNQRQVFGGVPSTEIKSIIIREQVATERTLEGVIRAIVKHGMFIPVFSGLTGKLLLTSQQFDQLSVA